MLFFKNGTLLRKIPRLEFCSYIDFCDELEISKNLSMLIVKRFFAL